MTTTTSNNFQMELFNKYWKRQNYDVKPLVPPNPVDGYGWEGKNALGRRTVAKSAVHKVFT